MSSGGQVVLNGEVRARFSTETGRDSTDVPLRLTAHDAAGKALGSSIALGHDSHFGRAYQAEDYYQNLSDGVMDALHHLLNNKACMAAITPK